MATLARVSQLRLISTDAAAVVDIITSTADVTTGTCSFVSGTFRKTNVEPALIFFPSAARLDLQNTYRSAR